MIIYLLNLGRDDIIASALGIAGGLLTLGTGIASGGTASPLLVSFLSALERKGTEFVSELRASNEKKAFTEISNLKQRIQKVLKNGVEALEYFNDIFEGVLKKHFRKDKFRGIQIYVGGFGCISTFFGTEKTITAFETCVPFFEEFVSEETLQNNEWAIFLFKQLVQGVVEKVFPTEDFVKELLLGKLTN